MQALSPTEDAIRPATSTTLTWKEPVEINSQLRTSNAVSGVPMTGAAGDARGMNGRSGPPFNSQQHHQYGSVPVHPEYGMGTPNYMETSRPNGIPDSVVVMPLLESKLPLASPPSARKTIRSRARPRKPEEPVPFLTVDTLPVDKVVLEGKSGPAKHSTKKQSRSSPKRISPDSVPPYTARRSQTPNHNQPPFSPYGGGKSTPRVPSRAGSSLHNYNSFFTHKSSAFLAGPPSLWSLGNRFWPHQATPTEGRRRLAPIQPSMVVEATDPKTNLQVSHPFKHNIDNTTPVERPVSPGQDMKESTFAAVSEVTRGLGRQQEPPPSRKGGRLLKGKLKPLHTFNLDGPRIEDCHGVLTEEKRGQTAGNAQLLQRKRELLSMLPPDVFQSGGPVPSTAQALGRPETQESVHRTSIVSALSLDRDYGASTPILYHTLPNGQLKSQSLIVGGSNGMPQGMPLGPFTSMVTIVNDNNLMSQVDIPANYIEHVENANQVDLTRLQDREFDGGDLEGKGVRLSPRERPSDAVSESSMSDYLSEGGRAEILCNMVSRVKKNSQASARSDPSNVDDERSDATEIEPGFDDVFPLDASHKSDALGDALASSDLIQEKSSADDRPASSGYFQDKLSDETVAVNSHIQDNSVVADAVVTSDHNLVDSPGKDSLEQNAKSKSDASVHAEENDNVNNNISGSASCNRSHSPPNIHKSNNLKTDPPEQTAIVADNQNGILQNDASTETVLQKNEIAMQDPKNMHISNREHLEQNANNVDPNIPPQTVPEHQATAISDVNEELSSVHTEGKPEDDEGSGGEKEESKAVVPNVNILVSNENQSSEVSPVTEQSSPSESQSIPNIPALSISEVPQSEEHPTEDGEVQKDQGSEISGQNKQSAESQPTVQGEHSLPEKNIPVIALEADDHGPAETSGSPSITVEDASVAANTAERNVVVDGNSAKTAKEEQLDTVVQSENSATTKNNHENEDSVMKQNNEESNVEIVVQHEKDGSMSDQKADSKTETNTGVDVDVMSHNDKPVVSITIDDSGNSEVNENGQRKEDNSVSSTLNDEENVTSAINYVDTEQSSKDDDDKPDGEEENDADSGESGSSKKDKPDDGGNDGGGSAGDGGGGSGNQGNHGNTSNGGQGGQDGGGGGGGAGDGSGKDGNNNSNSDRGGGGSEPKEEEEGEETDKEKESQEVFFKSLEQLLTEIQAQSSPRLKDIDSYDDIPEIEEAVLFCGVCGLDEDTCVCPNSSLQRLLWRDDLPAPTELNDDEDQSEESSQQDRIILEYKMLLGERQSVASCYSDDLVSPRRETAEAWIALEESLTRHPQSRGDAGGGGFLDHPDIMLATGKTISPAQRPPSSTKPRTRSARSSRPSSYHSRPNSSTKYGKDTSSNPKCGPNMSTSAGRNLPSDHLSGQDAATKGGKDVLSDSGCGSEFSEAVSHLRDALEEDEDVGFGRDGSPSSSQQESIQEVQDRSCTERPSGDLEIIAQPKPRHTKAKPEDPPLAPFPPLCFKINARPPPGKLYYFAYGPTMNPDRLSMYTGSSVDQRLWGVLMGFALKFNKKGQDVEAGGFANIEFSPGSSVEGCVYCLTPPQLESLDNFMGYPEFYIRVVLPVWMVNCSDPQELGVAQYCIPAVMYIAQDKWTHTNSAVPLSSSYSVRQCLKGADLLSPPYKHHLETLAC